MSPVVDDYYSEASDVEEYTGTSSEYDDEEMKWIDWFCNYKGNEFLVEVDEEYIRDAFNLTGLSNIVKPYNRALRIILDEADDEEGESEDGDLNPDSGSNAEGGSSNSASVLAQAARTLYGLIHARFILTPRGLQAMLEKYNSFLFNVCPNIYCHSRPVVPIGFSDSLGQGKTYVFCSKCNEAYYPKSSLLAALDGAYFGTTFAHLFFMKFEYLLSNNPLQYYVPKIFGFSIWRGVRDVLRQERAEAEDNNEGSEHKESSDNSARTSSNLALPSAARVAGC